MTAPLHERIRADFEARILAGELAPGARLPTEQALMAAYGCARMTVNKALSALAAAGLIDRRKRAGTFVARPRVHSMVLDVPDLAAEVRERGQDYGYRLLDRRTTGTGAARALDLDGLHLADGIPFALEARQVSLAAVPEIARADLETVSPGSWLLGHIPWTEAETRISALAAGADEARHLAVAPGTACLCVERRTWRRTEWITRVRQLFLGDAYDLVARFGPGSAR